MSDTDLTPAPPADFNAIADAYAEPDTYEITLPKGEVFTVRRIADASEMMTLQKRAEQLFKGTRKAIPPAWKDAGITTPPDEQVLQYAVFIAAAMVSHPTTIVKALRMSKRAGVLFLFLGNKILNTSQTATAETENAEIDEAKNESREAGSGETA